MGNHIVMEPASKIREIARNTLSGNWKPVVLAVAIFYLLTGGAELLLDYFFSYTYILPEEIAEGMRYRIGYGGTIYNLLLRGPFEFGLMMYLLTFFRMRKTDMTLLFEGFSYFGKSFLLYLLMTIKITLWTLLFIVPGVIAAFRYSQAFYVMVDHPEYSANQCLEESKRLMLGNKGRLFYLNLTFIGWSILASLPDGLFSNLSDNTGLSGILISLILTIPQFFLSAYMQTSFTVFYELTTEKLVVVEPGSGVDPEQMVSANYTVEETEPAKEPSDTEQPAPKPEQNPEAGSQQESCASEHRQERDRQAEEDAREEARYRKEEQKYHDDQQ